MTISLPESVRALVDGRTFAVLATIDPDGSPQSTVVWSKRDGDDIVVGRLTPNKVISG
jgi:Pyridoxamine 5'-phosphate oxidase